MFKVPDKGRIASGPYGSDKNYGNNGAFVISIHSRKALVIASDQEGWEHVSVSFPKANRCLSWKEMCIVKDIFWDEEDCVVQYHPPKSKHINCHEYTLHLWRPTDQILPCPPSIMVGPSKI